MPTTATRGPLFQGTNAIVRLFTDTGPCQLTAPGGAGGLTAGLPPLQAAIVSQLTGRRRRCGPPSHPERAPSGAPAPETTAAVGPDNQRSALPPAPVPAATPPRAVRHPADDAAQHALSLHRLPHRLSALARRGRLPGGPGNRAGAAAAVARRAGTHRGTRAGAARKTAQPRRAVVPRAAGPLPGHHRPGDRLPAGARRHAGPAASRAAPGLPEGPRFAALDVYEDDGSGDPLGWTFAPLSAWRTRPSTWRRCT